MEERRPAVVMTVREITDPKERAELHAWRERADWNAAWLQEHAPEVYRRYRGQFTCIAGEESIVADTVEEVLRSARTAHPEDDAFFFQYIPRERVLRIYAS